MTVEEKKHIQSMCKKIGKMSAQVSELEFYTFLAKQREFIKNDLKYNYFAIELKKFLKKHPVYDIHKFSLE